MTVEYLSFFDFFSVGNLKTSPQARTIDPQWIVYFGDSNPPSQKMIHHLRHPKDRFNFLLFILNLKVNVLWEIHNLITF